MPEQSRFDRDTTVRRIAEGRYEARIDPGWHIVRGPNGGYVAALLARAVADHVGDPGRPLRSLTVHYLRPPSEGPIEIETTLERSGRTVSTITARMVQNGKIQALATAAHALERESGGFEHAMMPGVGPPDAYTRRDLENAPPMQDRYDQRVAIGPPSFTAPRTDEAITGGWIRLVEPRPWDGALIAAVADAWPPAAFAAREMPDTIGGLPTIDLTVHLLAPDEILALAPEDFVLVRFETQSVRGGYLEEDGEIWSPGGRLLARSRQVGVVL